MYFRTDNLRIWLALHAYLNYGAGIKVFEDLFLSSLGTIFFDKKQVGEHIEILIKLASLALGEGPLLKLRS